MTEPFRPDDDLVSAVLDGKATADERARVLADPVLRARLEEFGAVRDLIGSPVPPQDDADRDEAIRRAIAEGRRPEEVVVRLRPNRPALPRWLATAAAIAVVVAAGFLVVRLGGDGEDLAGDDSADDGGDAGGSSEEAGVESEAADETSGSVASPGEGQELLEADLGAVADADELRSALDEELGNQLNEDGGPPPTTTTATEDGAAPLPGDGEACQVRLEEADPTLTGLLLRATATYAEVPAVVYVYATTEGRPFVIVVSADTCTTLTAFPA